MSLGTKDILSKEYFSNPVFFADAFNYLVYDGEPIIQPESLHPVDASEILLPYGKEGARLPIERLRDLMPSSGTERNVGAKNVTIRHTRKPALAFAAPNMPP